MQGNSVEHLEVGLQTAFIDKDVIESDPNFRAQLLTNSGSAKDGESKGVQSAVIEELRQCERFDFSVAFVTPGGIQRLKMVLLELEKAGIPGRFLTTDYNMFSDPKALRTLSAYKNIEVRLYRCSNNKGFHIKGFIFHRPYQCRIIIGSSNLTYNALAVNCEWNVRLISTEKGEIANHICREFEDLWNSPESQPLAEVIDEYEREWKQRIEAQKAVRDALIKQLPELDEKLKPNSMQEKVIENVLNFFMQGKKKALLISATGTGKTYAAAFTVQRLLTLTPEKWISHLPLRKAPQRILFLVHREQIARQAMKSFARVMGQNKTYGMLSGNSNQRGCDFTFATMQTMSKDDVLQSFSKEYFDLIIIDEVHRAGAPSYRKIMAYFEPEFWFGMTASPDRPDGINIYSMFDHNIAYEIRLQDALDMDLLCPFHYYGLKDITVEGHDIEDKEDFLNIQDRLDHILSKIRYYGYSGDRVKGLVFCRTKKECKEFAEGFRNNGYKVQVLTGEDSQEDREKAVYNLAKGIGENQLDYIFSVDVFNEGVDIPEINQVVLLRPTESPIIFIQQLGRGLRKAVDKEFVVILDFIGNYETNYLIPVALSGDNSYNKDNMRRYVVTGSRLIPGASTVEFEAVVKERILKSIDSARTNDLKLLRDSYRILHFKLGRIPKLVDYDEYNGIDPLKFFSNTNFGSYYHFLMKVEEGYSVNLSDTAANMLKFLSIKLGRGIRATEIVILEQLLKGTDQDIRPIVAEVMKKEYGLFLTRERLESAYRLLTNEFNKTENDRNKNKDMVFLEPMGTGFGISQKFREELKDENFRSAIQDLLNFMKSRYRSRFSDHYKDTDFVLYEKYTYEEVGLLLNWKKNMPAQNIGGYFYDAETKTLPVFVNYEKAEDAIAYEDHFESERELVAISKTQRKASSKDADRFYKRTPEDKDNRIYLFVRRNKDDHEAKSFYFLGEIFAQGQPEEFLLPSDEEGKKGIPVFKIRYKLETAVRKGIYDYIVGA